MKLESGEILKIWQIYLDLIYRQEEPFWVGDWWDLSGVLKNNSGENKDRLKWRRLNKGITGKGDYNSCLR